MKVNGQMEKFDLSWMLQLTQLSINQGIAEEIEEKLKTSNPVKPGQMIIKDFYFHKPGVWTVAYPTL